MSLVFRMLWSAISALFLAYYHLRRGPDLYFMATDVFCEKYAGSVARVCAGLSCLVRGCGRALSLIEIPQICQNVVRWTIA